MLHPTMIGVAITCANLWLLFGATDHQRWTFGILLSLLFVPIVRLVQKNVRERTMRNLAQAGDTLDLILSAVAQKGHAPDTQQPNSAE